MAAASGSLPAWASPAREPPKPAQEARTRTMRGPELSSSAKNTCALYARRPLSSSNSNTNENNCKSVFKGPDSSIPSTYAQPFQIIVHNFEECCYLTHNLSRKANRRSMFNVAFPLEHIQIRDDYIQIRKMRIDGVAGALNS